MTNENKKRIIKSRIKTDGKREEQCGREKEKKEKEKVKGVNSRMILLPQKNPEQNMSPLI